MVYYGGASIWGTALITGQWELGRPPARSHPLPSDQGISFPSTGRTPPCFRLGCGLLRYRVADRQRAGRLLAPHPCCHRRGCE